LAVFWVATFGLVRDCARHFVIDSASDPLSSLTMNQRPSTQVPQPPIGAIFIIGHWTLPIKRFIALLQIYGIGRLVDIRTIPRSRRNPQFNGTAPAGCLRAEHLEYVHIRALGGLRHTREGSVNTGWRNEGFRGYADYMQTEPFKEALETLISMSRETRVAIMCAEAVPWRCHPSLVADALCVRGLCRWSKSYRRPAIGCISSHRSQRWKASKLPIPLRNRG
jgi:uncharacterized protein (DUF488 family)